MAGIKHTRNPFLGVAFLIASIIFAVMSFSSGEPFLILFMCGIAIYNIIVTAINIISVIENRDHNKKVDRFNDAVNDLKLQMLINQELDLSQIKALSDDGFKPALELYEKIHKAGESTMS